MKTDDYLATLVVVDASMLNDPLLRIINQLGFADQATFSRYFHRGTGLYPTQFRNRS